MYQIDSIASASAPWETNEVVLEDIVFLGKEKPCDVLRYFQGITTQGYFLVQDFFKNTDIKFTDPFLLPKEQYVTCDRFSLIETFPNIILTDYIEYYLNGAKYKETLTTENEKLIVTCYYPSGQKFSKTQYYQGQKSGIFTKWYENGQKEREGAFVNDLHSGPWRVWHNNGRLASELSYLNGKTHGVVCAWHENGQKWKESKYCERKNTDIMYIWDEQGVLKEIIDYESL